MREAPQVAFLRAGNVGGNALTAISLSLALLAVAGSLHAMVRIAVQPLGPVEAVVLQRVESQVRRSFAAARLFRLPPLPLPADAYYGPRRRYRADRLLAYLEQLRGNQFDRILGITAADISTTRGSIADWGIFGLGALGGGPCVISTFRLRRSQPLSWLLERIAKVAVHELGHTAGLPHCRVPGCVMAEYRGSIRALDESRLAFCPACDTLIRRVWKAP